MSFVQANNYLAIHLHRQLTKGEENVIFSPFSISVAMGMLVCGATGETATELRLALGHEEAGIKKEEVPSTFGHHLSLLLQKNDSYTFSFANCMLSQNNFPVKEEYKQIVSNFFKALLLEVDFAGDTQNVIKQINSWVKEKTNNKIPDFLKRLDSSTVAVLLNAVYFKGTWMQKFNKGKTRSQKFYNNGNKTNGKKVSMMNQKEDFPYYEDSIHQVLQLPYIGDEVAMLILLPRDINGLDSLEASLSPTFVQDLKGKLRKIEVKVTIPRFKMEYEKDLTPCFQELGVKRVFNEAELDDFSPVTGLFFSIIKHKAVLKVNEKGTEAAAATMVSVDICLSPPPPEFVADHPFILLIYNTKNDLILFMGRVNEL